MDKNELNEYIKEFLNNGEQLYNLGMYDELAGLCCDFFNELNDDRVYAMMLKAESAINYSGTFPLPLGLLQNIRFMLSLIEKYPDIYVPREFEQCMDYLNQYFTYNPHYANHDTPVLTDISFSHELPQVRLGNRTWTLLFPKQMINRCKEPKEKKTGFSFTGKKTRQRVEFLQKWLKDNTGKDIDFTNSDEYYRDNSKIVFSDKGRIFPDKVWDEQYFNDLQETSFVICPNGDFIWTYRFFEAVMCRAIPVVEDTCEHYDGFMFYNKEDRDMTYKPEWVEHNIELLIERFTL